MSAEENKIIENIKLNETKSKKVLEFSTYVKIEKNGFDITKNYNIINICHLEIIQSITSNFYIILIKKSKASESIFKFDLSQITRIIDKFVNQEKLTINISKVKGGNENYTLFLSKTNEQVLSNFKDTMIRLLNNTRMTENNTIKKKEENVINLIDKNKNKNFNDNDYMDDFIKKKLAKKKKFKEFMNNPEKVDFQEDVVVIKKLMQIPKSTHFANIPIEMLNVIFSFLDERSKFNIPILNKLFKRQCDEIHTYLKFRTDTPSYMINRLLERFKYLSCLDLGKLKSIKNESIKSMTTVNLNNLIELNISDIINLNDSSIIKLFGQIKENIRILKFNFFLEGFFSAVKYIEFFKEIEEIQIRTNMSKKANFLTHKKLSQICEDIKEKKLFFSYDVFRVLHHSLKNKKLKRFSIFLWNFYLEKFPLLQVGTLEIDFLIVQQMEDLLFLNDFKTLSKLSLNHLTILTDNTTNEIYKIPDKDEKIVFLPNLTFQKINFCLFDNSIEIFTRIFKSFSQLQSIKLGSFANNETLRIISLHLNNLHELSIDSFEITDEYFLYLLKHCPLLEKIDLRGSSLIDGTCFIENNLILPENLKEVKLSIHNFNSNKLIEILMNMGIKAENYLYY